MYPKVVALDTDWTIWKGFLDHTKWGKGSGRVKPVENNIERVDRWLLRDKTNHDNWIRVYDDISKVVNDILSKGAKLAIVSRNPSKAMCDRALYYFNTTNPKNGKEWSIIHLVDYDEVVDESKVKPLRRIRGWSGSDFSDMILYDDQTRNYSVRIVLGVTFQLVRGGLTWDTYQRGLKAWRRAKKVAILLNPSLKPKRKLIGFSGLANSWIKLVRKGEGTIDTKDDYRWGYALYVGPSVRIARHFRNLLRGDGQEAYVCAIVVKDYNAWTKVNKIWIPENYSKLPWMKSKGTSAEVSGQNQEARDRFIAEHWNVQTPYVLFSRHVWLPGLRGRKGQRWSEMVVPTQIQRALFEVIPLSDAKVKRIANPCPFPFSRQFKRWSITVPDTTRNEFLKYKEKQYYRLSG